VVADRTVERLIDLQAVDSEILRIRGSLSNTPRIREHRGRHVEELEARLEKMREKLKRAKVESHETDVEVRSKESSIEKLNAQLNVAKSNQEYHGLREHIARLEGERDQLVDKGLDLLTAIEELEGDEKNLLEELEQARAEYKRFTDRLAEDARAYEADLAGLEAKRKQLVAETGAQPLSMYDRLFGARDGLAVVEVKGLICQGCFMSITQNDLMRLRSGREIVTCTSCQRIIFERGS